MKVMGGVISVVQSQILILWSNLFTESNNSLIASLAIAEMKGCLSVTTAGSEVVHPLSICMLIAAD